MNINQELAQIRKAIDAMNGHGFQQQVRQDMPAFGPYEAKAKLEVILSDADITSEQQLEAQELREWLREKCRI